MTEKIPDADIRESTVERDVNIDHAPYLIAAFNSARAEILERIKLRDQALFIYIAGVGAYFSFSFSTQKDLSSKCSLTSVEYFMFLPLPVFSLIMTLTILNHHILIEKLWGYLRQDLSKHSPIDFWDWSSRPRDPAPTLSYNRTFAQASCLALPLLYEIFVLVSNTAVCSSVEPPIALWFRFFALALCIFTAIYVAYLHIAVHRYRKKAYRPDSGVNP